MCGRSSLTKTEKEIEKRFGSTFYSDELERYNPLPNYNVAPTHYHPVIISQEPDRIHLFKWGLIPFWAKDPKIAYKMINARIETIQEKSTYKAAVKSRRCLVPMDGFYEWQKQSDGTKKPFRIQVSDQEIFSVAGLWEHWKDSSGQFIHTFTVITLPANEFMVPIHDRMPAILPVSKERNWIDESYPPQEALTLLQPYESDHMTAYEVTAAVGNVRNNDSSLIRRK